MTAPPLPAPRTGHRAHGLTLVELVAFIVIAAVVAAALIQAFGHTLRGSHYGKELTQATQLAQQRMEVILAQRKTLGYAAFIASPHYDPCQSGAWTAALCSTTSTPAGNYTVISTRSAADACGSGCTEITVTVSGPDGEVLAQLAGQVWDY